MKIVLEKAGKKFFREWIFRELDLVVQPAEKIAILGPNGSGKSTLLQMLAGASIPTEGKISYSSGDKLLDPELVFERVSISAPYLELIEEYNLEELIEFHFQFKKPVHGMNAETMIELSGLAASRKKMMKYYSSGMKQRVKLILAILSDVDMVLLDEPCSNLDKKSIQWYQDLAGKYAGEKTIIVCSNSQTEEYSFCKRELNVMDWKPVVTGLN